MLFSSNLFLYTFFPLTVVLYFALRRVTASVRVSNLFLLVVSCFFYYWGSGSFILVFFLSILLNYLTSRQLHATKKRRCRQLILFAGIALNLLILGYYKYYAFLHSLISKLLSARWETPSPIFLPIGISFYTFMAISYLVEVYREEQYTDSLVEFGTYMTLFPHLVAGPIVRYSDISSEIYARQSSVEMIFNGLYRFSLGLAKKVVIANNLGVVSDKIFMVPFPELTTPVAWLGMVCYTLQIYFDFAGYSDMAIGLAMIFGFHFPENFKLPYQSSSITEFWKRWHVSLSTWFRDFLYIPLGGNRRGLFATCRNLLLVFFFCGLWHGAGWTFIVWGLYHGIMLAGERVWTRRFGRLPAGIVGWTFSMILIMVGWVFFRSTSFPNALQYLTVVFSPFALQPTPIFGLYYYLTSNIIIYMAAGVAFALFSRQEQLLGPESVRLRSIFTVSFLFLSMVYLSKATFSPFIYFQF